MTPARTRFQIVAIAFILSLSGISHAANKVLINGAGATFPAPIYMKWFQDYNKVHPSVEINYQAIGSGGGIKQLTEKTVDFGASDAPMTDAEIAKVSGPVLHIPTVLGAVVMTYNLPAVKSPIKLDGETIAEIYTGKITKWNDPKMAALNKGLVLPDVSIVPIYRADSSGTTSVFTEYLGKVSAMWEKEVGHGKTVKWPSGIGGKGNEGVTGQVKNTPGAIGYIELTYATAEKLPMAELKNKAGNYITPSMKAVSEAAAGSLKTMPADFRVSITNAEGKTAYPISSFTYLLINKQMSGEKGKELVNFLNWAMTDGQKSAPALSYAALPASMVPKIKEKIKAIVTAPK
jgi:phosphate transport system substrate-binding protein